jgi:hypothetical protein
MGEGARPGRGGNNKIEGGEGVECCVFLSLEKHISAWGVLHTHRTLQASPAFGRMLGEGVCVRRGPGRGGNNKIEGGEGNECCVFFFTQNTRNSITSPAHSHELCPAKQASHAFDERWEKGHVLAEGGY